MVPSISGPVFSLIHTDDRTETGSPPPSFSGSTSTFTNVDFGTAPAGLNTRTAIIAYSYYPSAGGPTIDQVECTIDGLPATQIAVVNNGAGLCHWYCDLPTGSGATHTISLDYTGVTAPSGDGFSAYAAYNTTIANIDPQTDTSHASGPTVTYNYANYGVTAVGQVAFVDPAISFTNLTQRNNFEWSGIFALANGDALSATGNVAYTIVWNVGGATFSDGSFVAWRP